MVTYDFSTIAASPKASISSDHFLKSQMVGLEAFLGKPLDADGVAPTTEVPWFCSYPDANLHSECSYYCPTSTCAVCC